MSIVGTPCWILCSFQNVHKELHVACGYLPKIWILYSSGSLVLCLSMIAIWNPKHHSQRLCLSALAPGIRTASRRVTCLLWDIEMTSLSAHVFCSQAPKSYIIYCMSVLEPQNTNSGMACLLLPSSGVNTLCSNLLRYSLIYDLNKGLYPNIETEDQCLSVPSSKTKERTAYVLCLLLKTCHFNA
jgi:hypothetical protein